MVLVEERPAVRETRAAGLGQTIRTAVALVAVIAATLAGGYGGLVAYDQERELSVGTVRLSVSPGHRGALDLYVPLVDWGARFEAIKLPARLRVDLRTVNRQVVLRVANGERLDVRDVRGEARDAIAGYLRTVVAIVLACAAVLGVLVAFAIRSRTGPRLRFTLAAATIAAVVGAAAVALLLPPRGTIDDPQYYAHGADVPRALDAVAAVRRSNATIDQELDTQLVGLARLVIAPGKRPVLTGRPSVTIASDLHNHFLAIDVLARTADRGPLLFAGDLTDRGSPLETRLTERIVRAGRPFVFVSGNHDSNTLVRRLARQGAIVLTQRGRLEADGGYGDPVVTVGGLRVAGYSDPFERRSAESFRDRYDGEPSLSDQLDFAGWLEGMLGKVDVVMVHEPALIEPALRGLQAKPPPQPITFVVGHTHKPDLRRFGDVTVINGGSVGAGGSGNLGEKGTKIGIGRLLYESRPRFTPLAADLIQIDPGTGSSSARRERLDDPAPESGP